jgi:hypothetical protein
MTTTEAPREPARSAQRVVEALTAYGVEYVFGVPGAKIDAVFDVLADMGICCSPTVALSAPQPTPLLSGSRI